MRKSVALVGVCVVVVAIAMIGWLKMGGHKSPSSKTHSERGSGTMAAGARHETAAAAEPARALVTVRDASGPLAGATVRLSHEGDVTIVQTGADGTARADSLEAGDWNISASADGHAPAAAAAKTLRAGETTKIEIVLAPGGRLLAGTVTDVTGGPIAGARVDAAKLDGSVRPSDAVASATTGADGKYKLTVAEGQLLVAASEASYAPQSRYVEVGAAGATADFSLVPGGVIEGVVRDERSHEPVAGATVEADRDSAAMFGERSTHGATADQDGRFRITGLRPGAYALTAQAPHVASRAPTLVGIGVAEQVTDVEILVGNAPAIHGIVIDENGAPAPDVKVTAFGGDQSGDATSDAKGAFTLEGLGAGTFTLVGRSDTFLPAATKEIELADKDVDGVKVMVHRGLSIKGHVEPRQVCELELDTQGMSGMRMRLAPVTTAADGEFVLGPTEAGALGINARCASGDQGKKHVEVAAGMPDVIVEVKPGASIAGRVIDRKGKPVVAATVMGTPIGETEKTTIVNGMFVGGVQSVTNGKGEFELRGLAAGPYRLRVLDRGRPLPLDGEAKVTVSALEKKTGVTLTVDRPDGVIRGVVTGPDGKPLADAWVSLHQGMEDLLGDMQHGESRMVSVETNNDGGGGEGGGFAPVLTDATGTFEIANLPRVPWTVIAEAQGGKLRGRQVHVIADANITIQALGVSELKGTVKPAPGVFTVELDGPTRAQRSFVSADGSFSFGRVDPGDYQVAVTSSSGNGGGAVTVKPAQPATIEIQLAANATVIGKVVDSSGKPLGGVPVAVIPDNNDGKLQVSLSGPPPTTNPDGTFRLDAKAGRSAVIVLVPPRPASKKGLQLEAGKTFDAGTITVDAGPPPKP
jgi:protocatechuate 3,4-dioxygenase beta subunit